MNLARVLDVMITAKHGAVLDLTDTMFFLRPRASGDELLKRAHQAQPSALVAIDFLFWYGYGTKADPAQRMDDLNYALQALEAFECPVLISRFPDMRASIGKSRALRPDRIPGMQELEGLNKRLEGWVDEHDNVIVVPVASVLDQIRRGERIEVGLAEWPPDSKAELLQDDELHPTVGGLCALAYMSLDALKSACTSIDVGDYRHDPHQVAKSLADEAERARFEATRDRGD